MKRLVLLLGISILALFMVVGCGEKKEPAKAKKPAASATQKAPAAKATEAKPAPAAPTPATPAPEKK